jgi:hypothetical protein
MKKTIASIVIAMLLALTLTSIALAAPVVVEREGRSPFKGSMQAVEAYTVDFPTLVVDASGSGKATHLGKFTVSYHDIVNLLALSGSDSLRFVAANGDSLFAEGSGQATPTATPNVDSIVETFSITGGTGRFAGATGSFTVKRLLNVATGVTSGTFDGIIALPQDE